MPGGFPPAVPGLGRCRRRAEDRRAAGTGETRNAGGGVKTGTGRAARGRRSGGEEEVAAGPGEKKKEHGESHDPASGWA